MPRGGARGQNLGPCFSTLSVMKLTYADSWSDIGQPCDVDLWVLRWRSAWFWLISWRLFYVWTLYFGIVSRYDPTFDLKINRGHCDLYFMVQWFCLIAWRLFDVWTSYFGIMSRYGPTFDLKIDVGHCDLYFMVLWFCLISWRLFDVWTSYFGIMLVWPDIWPQNKCRSLWPIFHGPVIVPYISKTIWWMSVIFLDNETVWPKPDLKISIDQHDLYFMV